VVEAQGKQETSMKQLAKRADIANCFVLFFSVFGHED
jgi:hypothetical protein